MRRFQDSIAAGVDPVAMVEAINQAQAERSAVQSGLANTPRRTGLDRADVFAMIDALGDIGTVIKDARSASLTRLYAELRIKLQFDPVERVVGATAKPRVVSAGVRGRSCALTTRLCVVTGVGPAGRQAPPPATGVGDFIQIPLKSANASI